MYGGVGERDCEVPSYPDQKRLEKGRFKLPNFAKGCNKIGVTSYQLQGLIQGLDCWQVKEVKPLNYQHF